MTDRPAPPPAMPAPRIEAEPAPAARLAASLPSVIATPPSERALPGGGFGLAGLGIAVLVVGYALLATGLFVADAFARAPWLGAVAAAIGVAGFGALGIGLWRELSGLLRLRAVDALRAELAGPRRAQAGPELRAWLASLPEGAAACEALLLVHDTEAALALLRAGPIAGLRVRTDALARQAALQVFAMTASVSSPALDGLLVAWRGARLVRQVAALHGIRPGMLGTLALLRRAMLAAASVAVTDLAANTITRGLLSSPLLAHLAGDIAGAGLAARRLFLLARATATACDPLPPE